MYLQEAYGGSHTKKPLSTYQSKLYRIKHHQRKQLKKQSLIKKKKND